MQNHYELHNMSKALNPGKAIGKLKLKIVQINKKYKRRGQGGTLVPPKN